MSGVYDFSANRLDGSQESLSCHAGKVLLIVNVASRCGYTPQYAGLEALWRDYGARGLVVMGFPCNQFGAQEPGNAAEIASFCATNYALTFPLYAKIEVNGAGAHPLYRYLKAGTTGSAACS
jgi:glutathione peroxidase